jgi:predicted glutamine amidotransferase
VCRLLGYAAREPTTVAGALGGHLGAFTDLSMLHPDGWGLGWTPAATGRAEVVKGADRARDDPRFTSLVADHAADAALVHLRWATSGLAVRPENSHPFTDGRLVFAHNGSVDPPDSLDALLDPDTARRREGDTDSERYFLLLTRHLAVAEEERPGLLDDPLATAEVLARTIAAVAEASAYTSLNCMLLTPAALVVAAWWSPAAAERATDDYYTLRWTAGEERVVVASSGWPQEGARVLDNGSLLVVDRASLDCEVIAVGRVSACVGG